MDYFKTSIENLVNPYQVNDPNSHLELPLPAELLFDDMGILLLPNLLRNSPTERTSRKRLLIAV